MQPTPEESVDPTLMKMREELAKLKRKIKGFETGPRHFEHVLMNPPIPGQVMRGLFQVEKGADCAAGAEPGCGQESDRACECDVGSVELEPGRKRATACNWSEGSSQRK